jgi:hypothetical protein
MTIAIIIWAVVASTIILPLLAAFIFVASHPVTREHEKEERRREKAKKEFYRKLAEHPDPTYEQWCWNEYNRNYRFVKQEPEQDLSGEWARCLWDWRFREGRTDWSS